MLRPECLRLFVDIFQLHLELQTPHPITMGRAGDATRDQGLQIHTLSQAGMSPRGIAARVNMKRNRVHYLLKQPVTPIGRKGRPPLVTSPIRCRIVDYLNSGAKARRMPYQELSTTLELSCAPATLGRSLAKLGYHRRIARRKPFLSVINIEKRLSCAIDHLYWTAAQWKNVSYLIEPSTVQTYVLIT